MTTAQPLLYLDHAATAPVLDAARAAVAEGLARWANPSSQHRSGRAANAALEDARSRIAAALGWSGDVVFTSGASEALALAIRGSQLPLAAVSAVEHEALQRLAGSATRLAVDGEGLVGAQAAALPGLVAVQQVNSETGVIQPLAEIAAAVRGAGGLLLADCAQGAGKIALPDADFIVIAAHKFGGPVGIGALLVRDFALLRPSGGQERGYRPGTQNLPGALGMAAALEAASDWMAEAASLRVWLEQRLRAAGAWIVGAGAPRLPAIGAYAMPGVSAAAQLIRFDARGIAVSAGSACSSGSLKPSHVLAAMGYSPHDAGEVIRVSIGRETSRSGLERFVREWEAIAATARTGARARA